MQGPIAQSLALVIAGNSFVQGRDLGHFWPENGVFRFTKRCQFLSPPPAGPSALSSDFVAQSPADWLAKEQHGCSGFRLRYTVRENPTGIEDMNNNRLSVVFVGGGPRWLIEVVRLGASEFWEGRDELLDRSAPDRRIWATTYMRISTGRSAIEPSSRAAAQIAPDLMATLNQIKRLAAEIGLGQFIPSFEAAESALSANPPDGTGYYADVAFLFPLDLAHLQLLAATEHAWVFGGMGSWNDVSSLPGPQQIRYNKLSDDLFHLLCEAIVAVGNSTFSKTA